jgi:hypothetical protein
MIPVTGSTVHIRTLKIALPRAVLHLYAIFTWGLAPSGGSRVTEQNADAGLG